MSENVVRYNSLKELQVALAQLPSQMKEGALEALNESADFMVIIAQARCLVDTGTLQGSIRKEQHGDVVKVIAGGLQFINPKSRRGCDYAVHVERKNPFMMPAWESVSKFIDGKIRANILQEIQP